ncbi:MAG: hypothetical protein J7K62_01850 [Thermoplasmata archaeon]|nr:hypothetical protein [Thermoplasmata archaeon]
MEKIVTCPYCSFKFDISYGRTFACKGCPSSFLGGCNLAKCLRCGKEFNLNF